MPDIPGSAPKGSKPVAPTSKAGPVPPPAAPSRSAAGRPAAAAPVGVSADPSLGVAVTAGTGDAGTVTARKAGGLRDMALEVNPRKVGLKAALQHLAKSVNI